MLRTLCLLLVLAAVLGCDAPVESAHLAATQQHVVRGTVNRGDPAVAFIALRETVEGQTRIGNVCTGTLVDPFATSADPTGAAAAYEAGGTTPPRFVLTARHCIRYSQERNGKPAGWVAPPEDVLVFFDTQPNMNEPSYKVVSHRVHPKTDLAMLELEEAAPATPIPLNQTDLDDYIGDTVRVAGFGVTAPGARDAGVKRVGSAEILAGSTVGMVQQATRNELDTNADVAVVGPGEDGQSICSGDSGGPEFLKIDGVEYVAAVTSFSYGPPVDGQDIPDCTHPDTVAGVVRVDKNIEWIQTFVQDHGGAPEGFSIDMSTGGCQAAPGAVTMWSLGLGLFFLSARRRRRVF